MSRRPVAAIAFVLLTVAALAAQPDRALTDAMRAIYRLRTYTAFDWISARYQQATLTLEGFVRTPQLKQQAEAVARKTRGIEVVDNRLEVLPAHSSDDDLRVRAYLAIFGSAALERYGPMGQLSGAAISELQETARFGLEGTDVGRGPHAIHIVVSSGRVLLLGEVRAAGDRQIAEATIRTLPGVLGVTNQLRVARPRGTTLSRPLPAARIDRNPDTQPPAISFVGKRSGGTEPALDGKVERIRRW